MAIGIQRRESLGALGSAAAGPLQRAHLFLNAALAITIAVFAQLSESCAQTSCPPPPPVSTRSVVDPATGRTTNYLEVPPPGCVPYLIPGQGPPPQVPSIGVPVLQQSKPQHSPTPQESKSTFTPVQIKTGVVRRKGRGNQVSPLKIEADAGNYAVKLIEKNSKAEILMVFIGANQRFETKVPLGTYRILGASGDVWYGDRDLFGPSTSYFVLRRSSGVPFAGDDEFQFTLQGHTYHGHHIQLRKSVEGNLSTEAIKPDEFQQQ
jgi:hypothetical protein